MTVRVELQRLTKAWPKGRALDQLSLTVPSGKITALLGPSGCGKTTALKIVAGLLAADSGDVLFDGIRQNALPPERRAAVMVFQNGLLFPRMTVAENLAFGLRMRKENASTIAAKVQDMLAALHLSGLGDSRPDQLSGGQAQRAALGRALILRPKVLLLDEPLASLDPHLRGEMQALILDLQRQTGVTTLMVTHDQAEAVALADQIALMFDGKLHQTGAVRDFLDRPRDEQVARFFGGSNFIRGQVQGGQFLGPLGAFALPHPQPDGPATLTIRPEAICLGPGPNTISARITDLRDMGAALKLSCRSGDVDLVLRLDAKEKGLTIGQTLVFHLPPEGLTIMMTAR
jgi:ABC-type Fe3+/spermidine/putrescine transport system ATPase subunit